MVKLVAPSGAECEAEGDDLIASLKADGFTEGDKKPAKKAPAKPKSDSK